MADARTDLRKLLGNGINQTNLVDLLVAIRASIVGIQAKLDADAGVTDTNYSSLAATLLAAMPTGIQTTGVKAIHNQGNIVDFLSDVISKWNATLTKLDADTGVADTNYNALWAVTNVVGNQKIDGILQQGIGQSQLINVLNAILTSINGATAKLDLDAQVTDVNFNSLWSLTDNVDELGTYRRPEIGAILFLMLGLASLLGMPKRVHALANGEANVVQTTVTSNNVNPTIDVGDYDRFSMQATYQDGTPSSTTANNFTDGSKSTDTLTVAVIATSTIAGVRAKALLTVAPASSLISQSFTLNGYLFSAGGLWAINNVTTDTVNNISTNTAINIVNAVNAYGPLLQVITATCTVGQSTITLTAVSSGTAGNSFTLATSSAGSIAISTVGLASGLFGSATSVAFSTGSDPVSINIGTVTLTAGVDYVVGASTTLIAGAIGARINSDMALGPVIVATNAANVMVSSSIFTGVNAFAVGSSSPALLSWNRGAFSNGTVSAMNGLTKIITVTGTPYPLGIKVLLSSVSTPNAIASSTGGLVVGTTYFIFANTGGAIQLATGAASALTGPIVDISTNQAGGNTFTLTPLALATGTAGMAWQGSNNGGDWFTFAATGTASGNQIVFSSITYAGASNTLWDFQWYNWRYVRPAIVAPTSGGIMWTIRIRGKKDQQ